jgi:hypothetical protein
VCGCYFQLRCPAGCLRSSFCPDPRYGQQCNVNACPLHYLQLLVQLHAQVCKVAWRSGSMPVACITHPIRRVLVSIGQVVPCCGPCGCDDVGAGWAKFIFHFRLASSNTSSSPLPTSLVDLPLFLSSSPLPSLSCCLLFVALLSSSSPGCCSLPVSLPCPPIALF